MSIFDSIYNTWNAADRWLVYTPDRALERAYSSALQIKELEERYFDGGRVYFAGDRFGYQAARRLERDLQRKLQTVKVSLIEFNYSLPIVETFRPGIARQIRNATFGPAESLENGAIPTLDGSPENSKILRQLQAIDEITAKYDRDFAPPSRDRETNEPTAQTNPALPATTFGSPLNSPFLTKAPKGPPLQLNGKPIKEVPRGGSSRSRVETATDDEMRTLQTSFLPRSILRTIDRLKREFDPNAEEEVVEKFRYYKDKTFISLKFILLLILVPLLAHQFSKNFVIEPLYHHFGGDRVPTFINRDMEERAFSELERYEKRLHFQSLLDKTPRLDEEEIEEKLQERADEIAELYRTRSVNAIENVFADISSVIAFALVLTTSRQEVAILKSFMDDIIYGLSDSAKAFIIILFTDMFVGYHSPHGWEVILEGIARHFGLPESRDFNFLFIATFPVILDTVVKYWIFRYLNRISPSAVATYRNMNE